jgi:hypothetical protein
LDWSMAEYFLALVSSFSKASARSTVSPNPGASRIFAGTSPWHPAERQQLLEYLFPLELDYSRVQSCLHPLLGPPHRLQVARYCRRVDKIVCQKLESTTTSRGGLGHRRRTDWLHILNFRRTVDYIQT